MENNLALKEKRSAELNVLSDIVDLYSDSGSSSLPHTDKMGNYTG